MKNSNKEVAVKHKEVPEGNDRREFLTKALALAGGAAAILATPAMAEVPRAEVAKLLDNPDTFSGGGQLERMRAELKRALAKPLEERHWIMVIDQQKCTGCRACTVSCVSENNLPPGVIYRPVMEEEIGTFPNVSKKFLARPCMHCSEPQCVEVCPVSATYKRPDGVVVVDYDQCIGCRYCITSCPYGARTFDFGEYFSEGTPKIPAYETRPTPELGIPRSRSLDDENCSPKGNARKCTFCLHKISNGMLPGCITTCLGGATYFGDYNDKDSLVSELIISDRMMRLKEELGTKPNVFYLV